MPIFSPTKPVGPFEPLPPAISDESRAAHLAEIIAHCAPSTAEAMLRSLRARGYPYDVTHLIDTFH